MQKQRMSTASSFLLLGFLSVVLGGDVNLYDTHPESTNIDDKLAVRLLQEVCFEYPDVTPCNYLNSLKDEEEPEHDQELFRRKRSALESNQSANISKENERESTISNLGKREAPVSDRPTSSPEEVSPHLYQIYDEFEFNPEKRYRTIRIRNPDAEGYKRGPGFRSWGGKRAKFASWGGKRGGKGSKFSNWGGKRAKFVSWGGKRSDNARGNRFSNWGGKRAKFTSWGGKRAEDLDDLEKRAKFASWGGKRADDFEETDKLQDWDEDLLDSEKRAKFASWGGKRNDLLDDYDKRSKFASWGGKRSEDFDDYEKRAKFASWGGKRDGSLDDFEKRAKFASWGGKRDDIIEDYLKRARFANWGGKRAEDESENLEKRAKFTSWGGKRSDETLDDLEKRAKFGSWGGKRAKFASWGGKRGDTSEEYPKRAKFVSWGGKRDPWVTSEDEQQGENEFPMENEQNVKNLYPDWKGSEDMVKTPILQSLGNKRAAFKSWGGKRAYPVYTGGPQFYIRRGDFRKFLSWGGKRKFSSWGGKRSFNEDIKPSFNVSDKVEDQEEETQPEVGEQTLDMATISNLNSFNPIVNKKAFYIESQSIPSDINPPRAITIPLRTSEFSPEKENQEMFGNLR